MTTIAVTGASGFVGHHVLAALSRTDVEVVAHARKPPCGHGAIKHCRWVTFDLAASPDDAFDRLSRPDIVMHLAWDGLPNYLSPRHVEIELPTQVRFLRQLLDAGLKRLVVAGTCLEYGMQLGCLHEDLSPAPSNPYGLAKDRLRRELERMIATKPCDLRWLRLFYLYGDGQAPTSIFSQFRAAVARGDKSFDMSKGDQLRDYMKVEDAANAMVNVALASQAPHIVNICSGEPVSIRSLVERWRADVAAEIELNLGALSYSGYEPFAFWGDASRLAALQNTR